MNSSRTHHPSSEQKVHTMIKRRSAILVALFSSAAIALTGCSATSAADSTVAKDCKPATAGLTTFTSGKLTVGVPENPPYTELDGSKASGLEIDIIKKLAAAECLDVAYVPITYANGIAMINNQKRTDIITGGWYVTADRAKQVGFTAPTFYDSMAIISKSGIDTIDGLQDAGAVGSGTGFSWQGDMTKLIGGDLKLYPGTSEIKQDLEAGRIRAGLDGYAVAVYAYKGTDFKVEAAKPDDRVAITTDMPQIAFPVAKSNTTLRNGLSKLIDQYREDGTLAGFLADQDLSDDLLVPADVAAKSIR